MKTILTILFASVSILVNCQRDPRSKDQANVFWDGKYPLYSLVSDKQIKPDQNGIYNYWSATNEDPTPLSKSIKKGNSDYVYKFIDYSECYYWCIDIRKANGMSTIQPTRMLQPREEITNSDLDVWVKQKIEEGINKGYNDVYSNGRNFPQSDYNMDYRCYYCANGIIKGGWKNGYNQKKEMGLSNFYVNQEKSFNPQYLRKQYPYCSRKCADDDNY